MTNGMQDYYLTSTQFDSSPYCNSVIDCTDSEGNLSEDNFEFKSISNDHVTIDEWINS